MENTTRRRALLALTTFAGAATAPLQTSVGQVPRDGPILPIGLFTKLGEIAIPSNIDVLQSSGYAFRGRGAAQYVVDPDQTSREGISPWRRKSADGRWFRLNVEGEINILTLGASGAGGPEDIFAFNAAVGLANAIGSSAASAGRGLTIRVPDGRYDLTAGQISPILISNLTLAASQGAVLLLGQGRAFTVGSPKQFIENIDFIGFFWTVPIGTKPGEDQACVYVENAARIRLLHPRTSRIRRLVQADIAPGCTVTNIHVIGPIGTGLPDNNYIDLVNVRGGTGADLQLLDANVYPFAPPANVALVPVAIASVERGYPTRIKTLSSHGFATGDKVRLRDLEGMEPLNGHDYVVTRIDDLMFSVDADSHAMEPYRRNGYAPKLHWSWPFDTAVVSVEGAWDTIVLDGGVQQHWRHLAKLTANGLHGSPISFLFIRNVTWDYGGGSMVRLEVAGQSIGSVWIQNSWHFTLDGPVVDCIRTGRGAVIGLQIENLTIGMAGLGVFDDPSAVLSKARVQDVQVNAMQRLGTGRSHAIRLRGANDSLTLRNITIDDPTLYYGPGAEPALSPAVGFGCSEGTTDIEISHCVLRARTRGYEIPIGPGRRLLRANRSASGAPEYLAKEIIHLGPSPFSWTNTKGMPVYYQISGGTIQEIALMIAGEAIVIPHVNGIPVLIGSDQTVVITYTVPPAVVILPVNV